MEATAPRASTGQRWRRAVFVVITAWLVLAVLVVFFHGLGAAEQSGSVEARGAQYQRFLGRGWYPLEVDPFTPTAADRAPYIAINYSAGGRSTILPAPGWRRLTLRLAPIPCASGAPQRIEVRQGTAVLGTLTPPVAWASYSFTLAQRGQAVTLRYGCVVSEEAPGRGLQSARYLAILLGGVIGTG